MNADGSGQTRLTDNTANDYWPVFSPDGDGVITVADWVQAGRYAVGLDPLTQVGGPAAAGAALPMAVATGEQTRQVYIKQIDAGLGRTVVIPVFLKALAMKTRSVSR